MLKMLRAVQIDLCQALPNELLVPNPIFLEDDDNDYFIGVNSRRPVRYGRVVEEDEGIEHLIAADRAGVIGATPEDQDEEDEEERVDDIRFMLEFLQDIAVGSIVGCRYEEEEDGISWEMVEVEEAELR